MIDRQHFYSTIREELFHVIAQSQVDGLNHLLDTWETHYTDNPLSHLAYALATAYHETARTMRPIEEYGHGRGRPYGPTGYWGRGYVQLTWVQNYKRASEQLQQIDIDVDLVTDKEKALDPVIAAHVMFLGMEQGWFTGKKLSDYMPNDPVHARRIINGLDKAQTIAVYHAWFVKALVEAPDAPATS